MALTRRSLLGWLLAVPLAPLARYLPTPRWTPRVYTVPMSLTLDEINRVTLAEILPSIHGNFFQANPFMAYLRAQGPQTPPRPPEPIQEHFLWPS